MSRPYSQAATIASLLREHPEFAEYWQEMHGSNFEQCWLQFHRLSDDIKFWKDKYDRLPTLEDFELFHVQESWRWKTSQRRTELLGRIRQQKPDGGWGIERAFCIGTGTLTRLDNASVGLTQLAIFEDIVEHLQNHQELKIQTTFSDCFWESADFTLLQQLGIDSIVKSRYDHDLKVRDDAVDRVKAQDFTFCPFTECDFRVLAWQGPRLHIGNEPVAPRMQQRPARDGEPAYEWHIGPLEVDGTRKCRAEALTSEGCDKVYVATPVLPGAAVFDRRFGGINKLWVYVRTSME